MGGAVELPCDADGVCMVCKVLPLDSEVILCNGCGSPWHAGCLVPPIMTIPEEGDWFCPDCNLSTASHWDPPPNASSSAGDGVIHQIRRLQNDSSLSIAEKARKCQDIMSNGSAPIPPLTNGGHKQKKSSNKVLEMLDENLNCTFCLQLADRPVTTPCGHNFCLRCFQRWVGQGKKTCGRCRATIPGKMASQPRINSALVIAIRMAKAAVNAMETTGGAPPKPYNYIQNKDRPDKAFTTDRAKKPGKANASSGRIFVTVPPDHFGPILAENDPIRSQGVLVGETWEDRLECRQWGVHLPHVAGIAGQSDYGAQSVALSGGYQDDEDHGEWFLYTGSGGRDLSGNKRTNDKQSFDQKFDKYNQALRVSCEMGYPVRVVRSHKEKRSSYAPETGVRYDGIYRIERCWRKTGIQGFRVCRYLFVRCDNEPAPWTSDEHGDQPRPLPKIDELKGAINITERKIAPYWDWKEDEQLWGWSKTPPMSKKSGKASGGPRLNRSRLNQKMLAFRQRLLKEFSCNLCKKALTLPVSTPCGHNFCKGCIEAAFAGQQNMRQRTGMGGRSLRAQKIVKPCPSCHGDISDFLLDLKVNRQMEEVIESLKRSAEQESASSEEYSVTEESCVDGGLEMRMETKQDSTLEEKFEEKEDVTFVNTQEVSEVDESKGNSGDKSDLSNNSSKLDDSKGEVLDKGTEMCRSKAALAKEKSFKGDEGGDLEELDSLLTARQRQLKKPEKAQSSLSPSNQKSNGRSRAMSPKRNKKSKSNGHPAPPKEAETDSDVEFIGEVITVTSPRTRRRLLRKRTPIEPPTPNSPKKKIQKECHK